ncbi:CoB--CoM heterodisulfide reductase iron-sulfur subunit B family protein [Desulfovibrio ferrophilus]|uniref:CoB--CoM heterodisulfide reductase n=1 Tax=Desulfovibrio ferrophilus TaxID=241368 RepID=A0A2Z6B133_9BACT|nr:CoB--CoM heterodisulfide reductase iron-sulfur subunit B family protein [Desulfovibrio ferrophilus]BBD09237.1 CoB--CoM heterodisulfide reductase [Desulfovibrio ferrophilus]
MRYAYFPGCKIPHHLPAYGQAVTALCDALKIDLAPLEFNCCGDPVRHRSFEAWALSAGRNLALAHGAGLPIMTPCKCCFGSLKHAAYWLRENHDLRAEVNATLSNEGLILPEEPQVFHLLTVLDQDVPPDELAARAGGRLCGLRVAAHYGCHALRPGNVTNFDDPLNPTIFERLLRRVGVTPVPWDLRLECCGHPLRGKRDKFSKALKERKLTDARQAGAQILATACTYCQMQFADNENGQPSAQEQTAVAAQDINNPPGNPPTAMLAAQLIGLGIGLSPEEVGLTKLPAPLVHPSSLGHEEHTRKITDGEPITANDSNATGR